MTKRKKIGIITYWESNDNYGQQLQAWALQHYLCGQGYNAFLIRQYVWPPIKKKGVRRFKQWIKDTIARILYATHVAYYPSIYNKFSFCLDKEACRRKFPLFREQNLKMSKIFDTPEKLMQHPPKADVYITGSDQVWNYSMAEEPLRNFFLQFGDKDTYRVSYAPSIGHPSIPTKFEEKYKQYLTSFNAISVREKSAVDLIKKLGFTATHVLDPTMLLTSADYSHLASSCKSKPSIFIYSMNYASANDLPFEQVKAYAQEKQLPIIVTPGSGYLPAKELFDGVEYSYASIPQWIQHIANAHLVVTASFHGIVFAILFHRPFLYTPLKGDLNESNNRAVDLLYSLGLDQCIWDENKSINDCMQIDWKNVGELLSAYRQVSKDFLSAMGNRI